METGQFSDDEVGVYVRKVSKHKDGRRHRTKQHCCKFCNKLIVHISRHILLTHKDEMEVITMLTLPKTDFNFQLQQIEREGDFYHNKEVLATGVGELILVRRPTALEAKTHKPQDYAPCTNCLGFMLKDHLWHHVKYGCKSKGACKTSKSVKSGRKALLAARLPQGYSEDFENHVIGKIREMRLERCVVKNS